MKNIYLVGMMGSGKTTVARELAKLLQMPFIDLDRELEIKTGKRVAQVFQEKGEPWFRNLETEILVSLKIDTFAVFATGGGVVLARQNRDWMRDCGTVVYLDTELETLWDRVSKEKGRPLLEDFDPKRKLMSILVTRQPLYEECAHIQVHTDGKSPKEVAKEIQSRIKLEAN